MSRAKRQPRPIGDGICEVPLTKGMVALIDDGDAEKVSVCSWHANASAGNGHYYAKARMPGYRRCLMRMHCYVLCFPLLHVDHINGNGLDNRRSNLRLATPMQNCQNKRSVTGSIPYKGVHATRGAYGTKIRLGDKRIFLGRFPTALEAALAYDAAALHYFGEFAATNASLGLLDSVQIKEAQ